MYGSVQEQVYRKLKLSDISVSESLLVVSLRLWVLARVYPGKAALPDWRGGLCSIGLEHLTEDVVDPLFEALYGRGSWVEVVPLGCGKLSSEEVNLLACMALVQRKRNDDLKKMLSGITFPATARVVVPLLARLSNALEMAGMKLPHRGEQSAAPLQFPIAAAVH